MSDTTSRLVSREDLERAIDRLSTQMERGLGAISDQLATLNGRTRVIEDRSSVAESRLSLLERVVYSGIGLILTAVSLGLLSTVLRRP
jgi:hypothetical protein